MLILSQAERSDSLSPSQVQATSKPQLNQEALDEEALDKEALDEAAWPCKGCGEVRFTPSCCLLAEPPSALDQSAND